MDALMSGQGPTAAIRIFEDTGALSRAAAELFIECAAQHIRSRGRFVVALSGGNTPLPFYSLLSNDPFRTAIVWKQVDIFWTDERCVPPDHQESNYGALRERLLRSVSLPSENVHRIRAEQGPIAAAEAYERELRSFFGKNSLPAFDLIVLGAGEDGHTASLFPGSEGIAEAARLAVPVLRDPPGTNRVTLTLPVLNNAYQVLFLVAGDAKADMVGEILANGNRRNYPAGLVGPKGGLAWFLDREAARTIEERGLISKG